MPVQRLLLHVEDDIGVEVLAVDACLEVQMLGRGASGASGQCDGLSGFDCVATMYKVFEVVAVYRFQSEVMANDDGKEYSVSGMSSKGSSISSLCENSPGVATRIWLVSMVEKTVFFPCAVAPRAMSRRGTRIRILIYSKYCIVPLVEEAYFSNSSNIISAASFRPSCPL